MCFLLPDINCHLLPLFHKDVAVLRLGGLFLVLLRQVEGHGDVTHWLLFGLHAAGHRGRHGDTGLWRENGQRLTSCLIFLLYCNCQNKKKKNNNFGSFIQQHVTPGRVRWDEMTFYYFIVCHHSGENSWVRGKTAELPRTAELMREFSCITPTSCNSLL